MKPSPIVPVLAAFALLALTACGPGAPAPSGSPSGAAGGSPTATPTATPRPEEEPAQAQAVSIVVTGESLNIFGADGRTLLGTLYVGDPADQMDQLAILLGTPTVTTAAGTGSGCDTDQTMYDFGGLLIRSPGHIGTAGDWQVEVTAATTSGGVAITTVAGVQVGASQAAFAAAIGDEVLLGDYPPSQWFGYHVVNPEVDEYEHVGALARFDSGVLTAFNAPHLLYADC
jgi:hypothetical protein